MWISTSNLSVGSRRKSRSAIWLWYRGPIFSARVPAASGAQRRRQVLRKGGPPHITPLFLLTCFCELYSFLGLSRVSDWTEAIVKPIGVEWTVALGGGGDAFDFAPAGGRLGVVEEGNCPHSQGPSGMVSQNSGHSVSRWLSQSLSGIFD